MGTNIYQYVGNMRIMSVDIKWNFSACKWSRKRVTDHSIVVLRLLQTSKGVWCRWSSSAAEAAQSWCLELFGGRDVGGTSHAYQDHLNSALLSSALERKIVRFCFS